jgi:hypothetical protein
MLRNTGQVYPSARLGLLKTFDVILNDRTFCPGSEESKEKHTTKARFFPRLRQGQNDIKDSTKAVEYPEGYFFQLPHNRAVSYPSD